MGYSAHTGARSSDRPQGERPGRCAAGVQNIIFPSLRRRARGLLKRAIATEFVMPASDSLVSLDHAKDWAKRLLKHQAGSSLDTLAKSQEAVAVMLGHASWHALTRFYQHQKPVSPTPSDASAESTPFDAWMKESLEQANAAYPGLQATQVEMLAHDITDCEATGDELYESMRRFEDEGYFPEAALDLAFKEAAVEVKAPPGPCWSGSGRPTTRLTSSR